MSLHFSRVSRSVSHAVNNTRHAVSSFGKAVTKPAINIVRRPALILNPKTALKVGVKKSLSDAGKILSTADDTIESTNVFGHKLKMLNEKGIQKGRHSGLSFLGRAGEYVRTKPIETTAIVYGGVSALHSSFGQGVAQSGGKFLGKEGISYAEKIAAGAVLKPLVGGNKIHERPPNKHGTPSIKPKPAHHDILSQPAQITHSSNNIVSQVFNLPAEFLNAIFKMLGGQ